MILFLLIYPEQGGKEDNGATRPLTFCFFFPVLGYHSSWLTAVIKTRARYCLVLRPPALVVVKVFV